MTRSEVSTVLCFGLLATASLGLAPPVAAQDGGGLGGPGAVELSSAGETLLVDSVEVRLDGSTGNETRDAAILVAARNRLGLAAGDRTSQILLEAARAEIERLDDVAAVRPVFLRIGGDGSRTRIRFDITPLSPVEPRSPDLSAEDGGSRLPYLWRTERGALRLIMAGGHGLFSDGNPWFGNAPAFTTGNPLVEAPLVGADTGKRATWGESWLEFGLGGVTRIGDSNLALYGAATGIAVAARGQDIFRGDPRQTLNLEKAYLGLLWSGDDRNRSVNLSVGRQNFSLNDGFLISQFGSQWNAGPRPAVYLSPRTTHDMSAIGTLKFDDWTATAFYLDPNEYEPFESDTRLAGLNLRFNFTDRFYLDGSIIKALDSKSRYATPAGPIGERDGLTTYAGHIRWADPELAPGLWLEGELAHQQHDDFDMSAWAGYGTVGYLARQAPWTPSLSYRYSYFSGDDPRTGRYERFDALYSGGLSEWLQGISLGKVLRPENRHSHRVRFNIAPDERLNLTFDWFLHRADELNNIGANPAIAALSSVDLGQEFQLTARWAISRQLFFQGIAGIALPGKAIRDAADGNAEPWTTLQAQLFWSF